MQMYFLIIGCHLFFLFFFLNLLHDSSAETGTEAEVCLSVLVKLCKNYQSLYHDICWRAEKRKKPFFFFFVFGSPLIKLHNRALVEDNYIFFVEQKLLSYIYSLSI